MSEKIPTMDGGLKDWAKEDKLHLYQAIKTYGSHDIEKIKLNIPNKSKESIEDAIAFFKIKALKQEDSSNFMKEPKTSNQTHVPLNLWAKLLTENIPFNELLTETATALRLIADFEDIPPALCTEKIDFRKVYHTLANALEGKALCEDKFVAEVIDKCIIETALTSKAFMRCDTSKEVLKEIKINKDEDLTPFIKPTDNNELSLLRQLVMQKSYNPLNISEENLNFSHLMCYMIHK